MRSVRSLRLLRPFDNDVAAATVPVVTATLVEDRGIAADIRGTHVSGDNITSHGIAFGTGTNHDTATSYTVSGGSPWTKTVESLTPGTTYHYWAWETNDVGTGWSSMGTFAYASTAPVSAVYYSAQGYILITFTRNVHGTTSGTAWSCGVGPTNSLTWYSGSMGDQTLSASVTANKVRLDLGNTQDESYGSPRVVYVSGESTLLDTNNAGIPEFTFAVTT